MWNSAAKHTVLYFTRRHDNPHIINKIIIERDMIDYVKTEKKNILKNKPRNISKIQIKYIAIFLCLAQHIKYIDI